jgi:hypothetical protein
VRGSRVPCVVSVVLAQMLSGIYIVGVYALSWKNGNMSTNPPHYLYEPAPCDGCPQAVKCRLESKACRAFLSYVNCGSKSRLAFDLTKRVPSQSMFRALNARGK